MFGMLARKRTDPCSTEILEIRIHGVQNTPPAEMLETTADKVERSDGDELGSFWRRTDDAPADGITRIEAFSWGNQARTGGGALAAISRAVVHVGWFLLLPFALANLAYWTRKIKAQPSAGAKEWDGGPGASSVRIFSLLLTLIAVAAFCSVTIDLVAVQCFPGGRRVCDALPGVFDGLVELDRDSRAALLGLVPIATVLVLYLIGRRGRVAFEERVKEFARDLDPEKEEPGLPLLATRGFWAVSRIGQTSEWLHIAASVTLVLLLLGLDAFYARDTTCWRDGSPIIKPQCLEVGLRDPVAAGFVIGSFLLLIGIVVLVGLASKTVSDERTAVKRVFSMVSLVLAIAGYVVWTVLTFVRPSQAPTDEAGREPGFIGLFVTPVALVVLALFLALAGIGWKTESRTRRWVSGIMLVLGAAAILASHFFDDGWRWWLLGGAAALILAHLIVSWWDGRNHTFTAWRGQAPAVAMILALFASMALSSLLVLGVASWLNVPADDPPTVAIWRTLSEPDPDASLIVPPAYARFAVVLTAVVILMTVLVLLALVVNLVRFVRFSMPALAWPRPDDDDEGTVESLGGLGIPDPSTYAPRITNQPPPIRRRLLQRRSSHLLHRGEPLFGWLAVFAAIGCLSLASFSLYDYVPGDVPTAATAVLAAVALAAVAAVATHAAASTERPLGVFWDVVAFFPRAGHPFAPPCFGERVVPELAKRTRTWLNDPKADRGRGVILTAHSMGSTISAATLLALRGEKLDASKRMKGDDLVAHTALLSYGSQLRAYFSRFFPSVFGSDVLGVPGTRGPSLWLRDPWTRQVLEEFDEGLPAPRHPPDVTLTGMLGAHDHVVPRWRSLWRRTDYLGFPVYGWRDDGNPVDRGATESAPRSYLWRIATHSDYLGTPQSLVARAELVRALRRRSARR